MGSVTEGNCYCFVLFVPNGERVNPTLKHGGALERDRRASLGDAIHDLESRSISDAGATEGPP